MKRDGDLRSMFRQKFPEAQWTPIESPLRTGIPDHEFCFPNGRQGWIEYKFTRTNRVRLEPTQTAWLSRRARHGGRVFIAIRQVKGARDDLFILSGEAAPHLVEQGLAHVPLGMVLGAWGGGPRGWDWAELGLILGRAPRRTLGQ